MSIEISNKPVYDAQNVSSIKDTKYGSNTASSPVDEEEAYAVSKSGEKPNQFAIDYDKIRSLKSDYKKGYGAFTQMVSTLLQKQGQKSQDLMSKIFGGNGDFENVTDLGNIMASLDVDGETRAQAASLIEEDGIWGAKQVSQKHTGFCKSGQRLRSFKN